MVISDGTDRGCGGIIKKSSRNSVGGHASFSGLAFDGSCFDFSISLRCVRDGVLLVVVLFLEPPFCWSGGFVCPHHRQSTFVHCWT